MSCIKWALWFLEGHVIPSGTTIIIFAYGAGRNPEIFPEPDKFNPSRYDGEYILPFSYIPFSAGPRNCIGKLQICKITMINRQL